MDKPTDLLHFSTWQNRPGILQIPASIQPLIEWAGEHTLLFACIGTGSLILYLGALLMIPFLVRRVDADFFIHMQEVADGVRPPPDHHILRVIIQNIIGGCVMLAGFIMLFIPGQGLLTMFFGLLLITYPGKRAMVLSIVRHPSIAKGINWLRRRHGVEELRLPETSPWHRAPH